MGSKFDDIRPFNDAETVAALQRLSVHPAMDQIQSYLFPEMEKGEFASLLKGVKGVDDFQFKVMSKIITRIIETTTTEITYSGIENFVLSDGSVGRFLLLSTHRDIVLDPAFIQYILYKNNLPLTEIAVGNNLIVNKSVEDIIRSNRMIKVVRSENPREVYANSCKLSEYIRERITSGGSSVWIAHRQGRTKDGLDSTGQGLIKMLDMSGKSSFIENYTDLSIMPVAISYEYESCGAMKALELISKEVNGFYKKQDGEDLNSMIQGITQFKGRVHIHFCKPINPEVYNEADKLLKNEKFRYLAEYVDSILIPAFKLWPTNYIAADLLEGGDHYKEYYTEEEKKTFIDYIEKETQGMSAEVKSKLFEIYSAHVLKKNRK